MIYEGYLLYILQLTWALDAQNHCRGSDLKQGYVDSVQECVHLAYPRIWLMVSAFVHPVLISTFGHKMLLLYSQHLGDVLSEDVR